MGKERFTPRMHVEYHARKKGISVQDIDVAPVVILSWSQRVIKSLAHQLKASRSPHWYYEEDHPNQKLFTGKAHGRPVSLVTAPEGAPATVLMMEELIACGARVFFGLGWAGSLRPSSPLGTIIIPEECLSEEGTSSHYATNGTRPRPASRLVQVLKSAARDEHAMVLSGKQWTTDAPYRELISTIKSYRRQGVLGVDMETSAMYALGICRGVSVCNLLVVSDEIWEEWNPAFREKEVREATKLAQRVILNSLEYDL